MILILSIEQDESTIDVIKWLVYYKQKYILINNCEVIKNIFVDVNSSYFEIITKNETIISTEISSVWYRRGDFIFDSYNENENEIEKSISSFIQRENEKLLEYLHFLLQEKFCINNFSTSKVNKLIVLNLAKALGLLVPKTYISSNLLELDITKNYISKPISNPIKFYANDYWLPMYTRPVNNNFTDGDKYPNSLFQENIIKKFEIRCYYFFGNFYSMAIFSQSDSKTITDFRNYNHAKPNRLIPYKLPLDESNKLKQLAQRLDLETCSFDMICDNAGKLYFLEVNPIGQFGMVSFPCNYDLEKLIAEKLISNDRL